MSAMVRIDPVSAPHGVEVGEVLAALDARGIDGVQDGWIHAAANASGRVVAPQPLIVARGTPPTPGQDQILTLTRKEPDWAAVQPGDEVATLTGGTPGRDGRDVTGRRLVAPITSGRFRLGTGLAVDESGVLRAMLSGRVVLYPDGTLAVIGRTRHPGDLRHPGGAATAGLEFAGDLDVTGAIATNVGIDVAGSLFAGGTVEARRIECGEDLVTKGGLLGGGLTEGRGRYVAARDVACRFATACRIEAGRDVSVAADLMHCRVQAGGRLTVRDRIQGCLVFATGGVVCRSVGNSAQQTTVLEVGTDPELRAIAASVLPGIESPLQRVEHGRLTIAPLLARRQSLTLAQRQHAAKLVEETTKLEREVLSATAALRGRYERLRSSAVEQIEIEDVLGAGVVLRFAGLEAAVPESLRGPMEIRPDHSPGEPRLIITEKRSGATSFLPARSVNDPIAAQLKRVMARLAA